MRRPYLAIDQQYQLYKSVMRQNRRSSDIRRPLVSSLTPSAIPPALNVAVVADRAVVKSTVSINIREMNSGLQVSLAGLILACAGILKDEITAVNSDGELTTWGNANKIVKSIT